MNLQVFVKKSFVYLQKIYRLQIIKRSYSDYKKYIIMSGKDIMTLSRSQKKDVDSIYKKYGYDYSYRTHELCMTVTGKFDPYIFPEDLFRTTIEYALNNQEVRAGWSDKNYFDQILPKTYTAEILIRNINGVFYNSDFQIISKEQATDSVKKYDKFVIKPSTETGFGREVCKYEKPYNVEKIFREYKKNFCVQSLIRQHKIFSSLNESSVNVIRAITLFIDGKCEFLSGTVRCGAPGSFIDMTKTSNGKGMLVIGIDEDGCFKDRAYYQNGEYINVMPNGFQFAGKEIPNWDEMKNVLINCHKKMPHFGFIGWDIAINENGKPIIIEYNVTGPGVLYYQYTNGPLFGNRTEQILNYVKNMGSM